MKIVVIDGTGVTGSQTVAILRQGGHEIVGASRNAGGQIVMESKGQSPVTVKAGQTFYEGPTDVQVVARNASNTAPASSSWCC